MGNQQINKQRLPWIIGIAIVVIGMLFWIGSLLADDQPKTAGENNQETLSFTNSITGKEDLSFPIQTIDPNFANPRASLGGSEALDKHYNTEQIIAIIDGVSKFALTLSNSQATSSAIVDDRVEVSGDTATFKLFVDKPESFYNVTMSFANDKQIAPTMTFTREGE